MGVGQIVRSVRNRLVQYRPFKNVSEALLEGRKRKILKVLNKVETSEDPTAAYFATHFMIKNNESNPLALAAYAEDIYAVFERVIKENDHRHKLKTHRGEENEVSFINATSEIANLVELLGAVPDAQGKLARRVARFYADLSNSDNTTIEEASIFAAANHLMTAVKRHPGLLADIALITAEEIHQTPQSIRHLSRDAMHYPERFYLHEFARAVAELMARRVPSTQQYGFLQKPDGVSILERKTKKVVFQKFGQTEFKECYEDRPLFQPAEPHTPDFIAGVQRAAREELASFSRPAA